MVETKSKDVVVELVNVVGVTVTKGAVVVVVDGKDDEGGFGIVVIVTTGGSVVATEEVVVKTVKVVKGGKLVVDVVVVNTGCVVVVVDDVNELDVGVSVVVVHTSIVVELCGMYPSIVIVYLTPFHQFSGLPQHTPARSLYVPAGSVNSKCDCKL